MFNTSNKDINFQGSSKPTFEADIHEKVKIIAIEAGKKNGQNDIVHDTIDITFQNKEGEKHVAQEKEPDAEKASSYFEKMLHIANSFLTLEQMEKAVKANLKTYKDMQEWIINLHKENYKDQLVDVKIIGKVYSGNAFVQLPNFNAKYNVPFIKNSKNKDVKIEFTNRELKDLAEYRNYKSGNSGASSDVSQGGSGKPEVDF